MVYFALGQSTDGSPNKGPEFSLLSVRRANSCPEIKKTNGSSISSGTSPLQEETEEDHHGNGTNISNGHVTSVPVSLLKINTNHLNDYLLILILGYRMIFIQLKYRPFRLKQIIFYLMNICFTAYFPRIIMIHRIVSFKNTLIYYY